MSGAPGISQLTPVGHNLPYSNELNPDKLLLALEPEVAAIYCQQVMPIKGTEEGTSFWKLKENYMVLNIENERIVITVHNKVEGGFEVISTPMGNDMVGNSVNDRFSKMLETIVSDSGFSRFLSSNQIQRRDLLNNLLYHEFEQQKELFDGRMCGEMTVELPNDIVNFYGSEKIEDGAKSIDGVEFEDDTLYIASEVFENILFGPPVKRIVEHVLAVFDELDCHVGTLYLVGEFGGCKFLYQTLDVAIHKSERSCCIIVPTLPKLAIVQGAVMWRKNVGVKEPQRLDATYGIAVTTPFDEEKHDSHYRFYDEEQQHFKCQNVFEVFLRKGQMVTADDVFTATLIPSHQSQTTIQLDVYSTPNFGVRNITDKNGKMNITKIGELILDIPNPDNLPREKRIIDVTMCLGRTEIHVKAKYHVNGQEVKSVIDILSSHT